MINRLWHEYQAAVSRYETYKQLDEHDAAFLDKLQDEMDAAEEAYYDALDYESDMSSPRKEWQ